MERICISKMQRRQQKTGQNVCVNEGPGSRTAPSWTAELAILSPLQSLFVHAAETRANPKPHSQSFFLFWLRHPAVDLQRCWVVASAVLPTPLLLSRRCTVAVSAVHRCSPSWLHTSGQPAIPLESVEDRETKAAKHPDGAQRDIMLGQAGGRPCLKAGKLQFISGFPK